MSAVSTDFPFAIGIRGCWSSCEEFRGLDSKTIAVRPYCGHWRRHHLLLLDVGLLKLSKLLLKYQLLILLGQLLNSRLQLVVFFNAHAQHRCDVIDLALQFFMFFFERFDLLA